MNKKYPTYETYSDMRYRKIDRDRKIRRAFEITMLSIAMVLFAGWLAILIWFAVAGVRDNSCTSADGSAVYCGE